MIRCSPYSEGTGAWHRTAGTDDPATRCLAPYIAGVDFLQGPAGHDFLGEVPPCTTFSTGRSPRFLRTPPISPTAATAPPRLTEFAPASKILD